MTGSKMCWWIPRTFGLVMLLLLLVGFTQCPSSDPTQPPQPAPATTPVAKIAGDTMVFALVYYGHPLTKTIDIVFVPDHDSYFDAPTNSISSTFLTDARAMIKEGFWQNNAIYQNMQLFNFWYTTQKTGTVESPLGSNSDPCPRVTWPDLNVALWVDALVILHRNKSIEVDCGWTKGQSQLGKTIAGSSTIVVHEFSHAAFGLPDEYCGGGYWHAPPVLYGTPLSMCEQDPTSTVWRGTRSSGKCTEVWDPNAMGTGWERWNRSEGDQYQWRDIMAPPLYPVGTVEPVLEYGPADWVVVQNALSYPGNLVRTPVVFGPDPWPDPQCAHAPTPASTSVSFPVCSPTQLPTFVPADLIPAPTAPVDEYWTISLSLRITSDGQGRVKEVQMERGGFVNSYEPNVLGLSGPWTVELEVEPKERPSWYRPVSQPGVEVVGRGEGDFPSPTAVPEDTGRIRYGVLDPLVVRVYYPGQIQHANVYAGESVTWNLAVPLHDNTGQALKVRRINIYDREGRRVFSAGVNVDERSINGGAP